MSFMLDMEFCRINRNNSAWVVIQLLNDQQGVITKAKSDQVELTLNEGDEVIVKSSPVIGSRAVYVKINTKGPLPEGIYGIYIRDGRVRTDGIPVRMESPLRAKFVCTKSTNTKETTKMINSCFKLIEGELKTTNQAYNVIKRLGETRRVHSSADGMNDILRIPTGTKFHVVVRGDSKAMLVFMEGKFGGNVTYRQLLIDANKHVITVGNILQSLDLVRRNVAVLEWICDEPVKEVAEPAAPAPAKSNISVTTEHGYHQMSQMIYTDKLVIGNVNYRIGFANNGMEVRIGNADDGRWLLAVINYLGRLSNLKDASVIVVSRIIYEDNSVGAMMVGVPGQRSTANNYYVMSSVDGELRSCGIPDKHYPTGMEMHVIIEGPVEDKTPIQKKEQSEWIPHSGQFVVIKDDPKKTMYILSDYDQAANKFVLTLADSARRERLETLKIRGEQATVMVEPSKIRPFVLTY